MDDLQVKQELMDLEENDNHTINSPVSVSEAQGTTNPNDKENNQSNNTTQNISDYEQLPGEINDINRNSIGSDNLLKDGAVIQNKQIKKRKLKRELDFLDIKIDYDDEFDSFADNNSVYRKYRLRGLRTIQKSDSPEPESISITKNKQRKKKYDDDNYDMELYECSTCKKEFDSKTGLLNHMRMHQTARKFMCALCFADFNSNSDLIKHKFIHEDEGRTFICKLCKLAFTNHCDFLIHDLSHMFRVHYKCTECGLYYYTKNGFQIHIQTHFDRKSSCTICGSTMRTTSLQTHMSTYHGNVLECVECGKKINGKHHYDYHMASHTGVKLFQCLYCGKGFLTNSAREVHTRIHTDERPYECKICHQKFRQQTDWKRHTVTHETEKKYNCEVCNKKFFHKENIAAHMSVHNGTEKYKCKVCGKAIATKTGVRTHMLYKHTTDKLFSCEICDMSFKDKKSLNRHTQSISHRNKHYASNMQNDNPNKISPLTANS